MSNRKILCFIGILFICLGVLCNESVLAYTFSPDGRIERPVFRIFILLFDAALVVWGLLIVIIRSPKLILNINHTLLGCFLLASVFYIGHQAVHQNVYGNVRFQLFGEMVSRVITDEKAVALTFDDGPVEPFTRELIDVLDRHKIKATFFLIGKRIKENGALALLLYQKGHQLANHTYDHKVLVYKTPSYVRAQIEYTNVQLRDIGVDGPIDFRAPHGKKFIVLPYILSKMQLRHVLFDIEPQDWRREPDEVIAYIMQNVKPGSIILLHDGSDHGGPHVAETTDQVIKALKNAGYQFRTVAELIEHQS